MATLPRPIRLLTYDLDDTLYPERDYIFCGFAAVARAHADLLGDPDESSARLRTIFDSGNRTRSFNQILQERGIEADEPMIAALLVTFRSHWPSIALHADADRSLSVWQGRVRTAILSDGYLAVQENKVRALGLAERVGHIVLTDRWGREFWKPHPRGFEELQAHGSATGSDCAYVSDNPAKDFIAPNKLGWLSVLIRRPGGTYENAPVAPGGEPLMEIADLADLEKLLIPR